MPRLESINLLDSDRGSSDNHSEDTLSGYARASKGRPPRFLTSWDQVRPFVARHLDKLSTERRPAGLRATLCVRRLIYITLVFGACFSFVFYASWPLSTDVPHDEPPPPPLLLSNPDATTEPPGLFDVCSFVHCAASSPNY